MISPHPHACVVADEPGRGVPTCLGSDTVRSAGLGFELPVTMGDAARRGDPLVRWDPFAVASAGKSPVCPVVASDAAERSLIAVVENGDVEAGTQLFFWG